MRIRYSVGLALALIAFGQARADKPLPLPKNVPPVLATATVGGPGQIGTLRVDWRINLTIPKIAWEVIQNPQRDPEIKAEVKQLKTSLRMGGPSAMWPSKVVDLKGKELTRDQVFERLQKETPVLLSVTGRMPDAHYLQLTKEDTLIVILGPRDIHYEWLRPGNGPGEYLPARAPSSEHRDKGE